MGRRATSMPDARRGRGACCCLLFRRSGAFGALGTFGTCVRRDSRVLPGRRFGGLPRGVALGAVPGAVAIRVRRRMRARGIDA